MAEAFINIKLLNANGFTSGTIRLQDFSIIPAYCCDGGHVQ